MSSDKDSEMVIADFLSKKADQWFTLSLGYGPEVYYINRYFQLYVNGKSVRISKDLSGLSLKRRSGKVGFKY